MSRPDVAPLPIFEEVQRRGYRAVERLGGHDFADTYRGYGEDEDRPLVIKVLDVRQIETWKQYELFERQKQTLASLDHPGIPNYVDCFQFETADGPACAIVYEFVEGRSLDQLLTREEPWAEGEALDFLRQMLSILDYLHSFSPPVVHRDIKPSNILRGSDGKYVLIDFGAVQTVLAGDTGGTTFVGTTGYMPPEQMMGRAVAASDLYALGATTVHMLTGMRPRLLTTNGVELDFADHVDVSGPTERLLDWLLEPDLDNRASDAGVVRWAIEAGRIPESEENLFDGWQSPPVFDSLDCRIDGEKVELNLKVEEQRSRIPAYLCGGIVASALILWAWKGVGSGDLNIEAAIFGIAVVAYALGWPVAIWLVLRRPRRERLERYIGVSQLNRALVFAILFPWLIIPFAVVEFLSGSVGDETERLAIDERQIQWQRFNKRGSQRDSHMVERDCIQDVYFVDDHLMVETDNKSVSLDASRCSVHERQWLLQGLRRELFGSRTQAMRSEKRQGK